ncbi:rhodanese-like domain-containing protein [Cyclobacterium jeungdonense]|uniref:Rhodanese-like domain-containing protein n=1 Tax=Cyclobacterium jeungdonense TaxID=708087 RepID=A0ABT8C1Q2_9BACT|nr:rhodanese-like domain-containing protein [Cyclobacterium jeungdonense]MDN3686719.1 rhodanese-like domain-containing protein [Cyclobacterium jeungdonense]
MTLVSRSFTIKRKPENPLNGNKPSIKKLLDYEAFCGINKASKVKQLLVEAFHLLKTRGENFQLIDVREPYEYQRANLGGKLIPLSQIDEQSGQIERNKKVIFHCEMGARSEQAIKQLEDRHGFIHLFNLQGGIKAYLDRFPNG